MDKQLRKFIIKTFTEGTWYYYFHPMACDKFFYITDKKQWIATYSMPSNVLQLYNDSDFVKDYVEYRKPNAIFTTDFDIIKDVLREAIDIDINEIHTGYTHVGQEEYEAFYGDMSL